ncbi:MAG: Ribosomal RNA small subunit methyltransferase B [Calditrichaeota bacterium]|nr:Ribosomal RNA small subunit methyltransferase B [Calditrichota bacterium]
MGERPNPRRVAADILASWETGRDKIDQVRDELLAGDGWDDRDRALVTEIVYGVVRHRNALRDELGNRVHAPLKRLQAGLLPILEVGLYQLRHLDRVPAHAAVNEAVNHARELAGDKPAGLVNAVLRASAKTPVERPVDAFSHPGNPLNRWRDHWAAQWGEEKSDTLVRFFSRVPPTGLRRNLLKTESDEQWHGILREEAVEFEAVVGWPGYLYAREIRPDDLPSFRRGLTTVQDPSTSLAVTALDPRPGETILDLCCAPGGKTALIWERMGGRGELVAVDKSLKRNQLTRRTLQRLGHTGVRVLTEDLLQFQGGPFDRVLIDVPCSGTGVAHRRADLLIRRAPLQIDQLAKVQRHLLNAAAELVKPGGVLVYSTCSLEPAENETRVSEFDKRHGDRFARDPLSGTAPEALRLGDGIAGTWPPRDGVDGAFVARWRRFE